MPYRNMAGLLVPAILVGGLAPSLWATDIDLGPADFIALDQPQVTFAVTTPGTDSVVGPDGFYNNALLDTGANGLLLGNLAYTNPSSGSDAPFTPATRTNGSTVTYIETGVAGAQAMTVYRPYDLQYAGSSGAPVQLLSSVNLFGSPDIDLGVPAVLGMPTMQGRIVTMDPRPLASWETLDSMTTQFVTSAPASATGHSYHIALPMLPYEHTGTVSPDDPKPTFANLPQVRVSVSAKQSELAQTLLLDTGAQTSIISTSTALAMGMNLSEGSPDILDYLDVGGIGGTVAMPIVQLDRITLRATDGTNLVFRDVQVGVLDIQGIGGVFGMNMLTTGYGDLLLGDTPPEPGAYGAFAQIVMDFTNSSEGDLRLDVNPAYLVPEPTGLGGVILLAGLLIRRHRRTQWTERLAAA